MMKLYEIDGKLEENICINVDIPINIDFDEINIVSSSFYSIFLKNELIQFGPSRSPNEFLRVNKAVVSANTKDIKIEFINYGVETFDLENRHFVFGFEFSKNGKLVLTTSDCKFFINDSYLNKSNRYSFQRGFIERHDFTKSYKGNELKIVSNKTVTIIGEAKDYCNYNKVTGHLINRSCFEGFGELHSRPYNDERINTYNPSKVIGALNKNYIKYEYDFQKIYSGILNFEISSNVEQTIYLVFDEYLPNGKWQFSRSTCNDFIEVKLKKGTNIFYSKVPYTLRHLLVLTKNEFLSEKIAIVKIQNDCVFEYKTEDKRIDSIINAATRSFKQNAVDIFTDCPGRERAGWLCDSYFSGRAEYFFTGNHNIERNFLENFIYEKSPELPEGMVPMCYPSIHKDHTFIPNWALWLIIEIEAYFNETNDRELVEKLRNKVFGILNYFNKFENEYLLLENLESWVFVEWSKASDEEYLKEISISSNILYKGALDAAYRLYGDENLLKKSEIIKSNINRIAFNGEYYLDNARRINGKVIATKGLVSETNQYFAYFFKVNNDDSFLQTVLKANTNKSFRRSAVFIGKFLRLLCLYQNKLYSEINSEYTEYFLEMAEKTSTLWEKDEPTSSCNHGFTSILAPILYKSYTETNK